MALIILQDFETQLLTADYLVGDTSLPLDATAIALLDAELSVGDHTYLRVIGGTHYEIIRVTRTATGYDVVRGECDLPERDFTEGDCVIMYEDAASKGDQQPEPVEECTSVTETPEFIQITQGDDGECIINFIGDINECDDLTQGTINAGTRILIEGCEYITVDDICEALVGCSVGSGTVGPSGPLGDTGPQGITGNIGPVGPQGVAGADGVDGADGANGVNGVNGTDGVDGIEAGSGDAWIDVSLGGLVTHNPPQAATQTLNGTNYDARGHAVSEAPDHRIARWSGNLNGTAIIETNLTSALVLGNIEYTFTTPMPNGSYYISIVDDNGSPVPTTIAPKSASGFTIPAGAGAAHIFIHA